MSQPVIAQTPPTQHEQSHHTWKHYALIYGALIILTTTTFGVSILLKKSGAPTWTHFGAALAIAAVKVSLVVLFFMHLKEAEGANKMAFVLSIVFVGVLLFFVLMDTAWRFKLVNTQPEWTVDGEYLKAPHSGASPEESGQKGSADIKH